MEFINKLKEMGSETYKYTTEKTNKIAKETKLKMKINQNKSKIEDIYEEIGKAIYQNHIREQETDVKECVKNYCKQIDDLSDEIEKIREDLLNLKDKKKCDVCAKEMDIESKFCPQCGKKQPELEVKEPETEVKEVEIVNDEDE